MNDFLATTGAWTIDILSHVAARLPLSWRIKLIRLIGQMYGRAPHGQRRALEANLRTFLKLEGKELHRTVRDVFTNFLFTLYDFFFPKGLIMAVPDRERLETLRKQHGGVMVLTFHMGNWELGARKMQEWGWPVTAVYQPYTNKKFKQLIEPRRAPGVNFIAVGANAANGVREALRRGDMVAMLGDHPFGEDGTPVDLLGRRVIWPKGPVLLAVREQAPIVIAVIVRTGPRQYRAIVEPALLPNGRSRAEVQRLVQEVAHKFGKILQQFPTQWYRFRPFEFAGPSAETPVTESNTTERFSVVD